MVDMTVSGELEVLIAAIMERKRKHSVRSTRRLVDTDGLPVGRDALRYRFDQARLAAGIAKVDFQFRDLRAKAGTDKADSSGDMRQAQSQLGHKNITMTEHYVRKRRGARTTPTW